MGSANGPARAFYGEPMDEPTERQTDIYKFILEEIAENFAPPTVRMIQERFGIRSPNGVCCHLRALIKKGYLRRARPGGPYVSAPTPGSLLASDVLFS